MSNLVLENIGKMVINGNRLELPKDEVFTNYAEVKKVIQRAGGKYKKNGFEFDTSPHEIVDRLLSGDNVDDKKKFQYFPTPSDLAQDIVDFACIDEGMAVLEPSAGMGAIAEKVRGDASLTLVEVNEKMIAPLKAKFDNVINCDFLAFDGSFDRVVANPPFTKNQDIDHVLKMYDLLKDGGRLVSIMSNSWRNGSQQKQVKFREFVSNVGGEVLDVDAGVFKESGTSIATCIVIINK